MLETWDSTNSDMHTAVAKFNKTNTEYQIKIRQFDGVVWEEGWTNEQYMDAVAEYNNSLLGDDGPDLVVRSRDVDNAILEDLTPYLENSELFSEEDFVSGVLQAYTWKGKLLIIPDKVTLTTWMGYTSQVGEESGWTMQEIMDFINQNPTQKILSDYPMSYAEVLWQILPYSIEDLVDTEKGECYFDTREFMDLLAFVNCFPYEVDYDDYYASDASFENGDTLLDNHVLSDVYSIPSIYYDAGEDVTNMGYPTIDGGWTIGITANNEYAILSGSQNKEGAWAFIESVLTDAIADRVAPYEACLPSREAELTREISSYVGENGFEVSEELSQMLENAKSDLWRYDAFYYYCVIVDEADAYFRGEEGVEEAAKKIQDRCERYLSGLNVKVNSGDK